MECGTFFRNMHGKHQDWIYQVTRNKHGDECMQNLKQKENFESISRPKCPKPLLLRARVFMKVAKSGDAFLIYTLPSLDRC
jgi:hypothetical protein